MNFETFSTAEFIGCLFAFSVLIFITFVFLKFIADIREFFPTDPIMNRFFHYHYHYKDRRK